MTTKSNSYNPMLKSFRAFTGGGGGGGGGGGMDIKVKVSAADLVTDYLSGKMSSADDSVTFTILNPAGDETYDVSIAPITISDVAAKAAIVGAGSLIAGRMYYIPDAYGGDVQIYMFAEKANLFDPQGFGYFKNANTASPVKAFIQYDVANTFVTELYFPFYNLRVTQSVWNNIAPITNAIDTLNFANVPNMSNTTIQDCTFDSTELTNCTNSTIINSTFVVGGGSAILISDSQIINASIDSSLAVILGVTLDKCNINGGTLTGGFFGGTLTSCTLVNATVLFDDATMTSCIVLDGGTLNLSGGCTFTRCKVGQGKTVQATTYNATNSSLEDLDSTYEAFLDPDGAGVMDMANYKFAGVVRIGNGAVPAAWDLKIINNFPTDHIFCIIPADTNTVDVYDVSTAGVGGNLYLQTAATVPYDGTKDDTLVLRSGLNDYSRLFQIGGWQSPSA